LSHDRGEPLTDLSIRQKTKTSADYSQVPSSLCQEADQGENKKCPDRHTQYEEQSISALAVHVT
jgi:hypothetical protein